jgi:hypothetical protein
MDILELERARADAEEPVRITMLDSDGQPYPADGDEPFWIAVRGRDSEAVRKAARKVLARAATRKRSGKRIGDDVSELTEAELDELRAEEFEELLVDPEYRIPVAMAACAEWGAISEGGAPFPFTPLNLRRVLSFEHHLGQVETAMREHGRPSSPQSAS